MIYAISCYIGPRYNGIRLYFVWFGDVNSSESKEVVASPKPNLNVYVRIESN